MYFLPCIKLFASPIKYQLQDCPMISLLQLDLTQTLKESAVIKI